MRGQTEKLENKRTNEWENNVSPEEPKKKKKDNMFQTGTNIPQK